ncbi:dethiobiotin synthase [Pseudonocardia ailaonensis]|uniref:ATP-dependent dethiobiotin synthetase BioD n=1 Tax=Pseudonocardia ailaonensis TaxID=367279 RepID=A0ABN2N6U3_9PSEU
MTSPAEREADVVPPATRHTGAVSPAPRTAVSIPQMSIPPVSVPPVVVVTGTDTGVGKTITTAALAAALAALGRTVAVVKPVQAGTEDGAGDADVVARLATPATVREGIRLPDPMAPVAAAERARVVLPPVRSHASAIRELADRHDHVLVEGAGGILVELDGEAGTLADLAVALGAPAVVVCRSGLGTLNHTALTREALERRGVPVLGLAIGAWPESPGPIEEDNRRRLGPLLGAIPEGAGTIPAGTFRSLAPAWFPTIT